MKVKICGMKYLENIVEISKLEPDYLGFIFWKNSKRYFDASLPALPESIQKVGVFVDASYEEIAEKIRFYKLDVVQLHGLESVEFCRRLKNENVKIIKAFSLSPDFDFEVLRNYEAVCDYFLFDTKGKLPGGNGQTFDWDLLKKYTLQKPIFLSGGIGLEEIPLIKALDLPVFAIDMNSKLELEPGLKDIKKCKKTKALISEFN